MEIQLTATNIKKLFNRRVIFERISFTLHSCQTLLITGRNGSGKSTLVKIISSLLTPSEGSVEIQAPGVPNEAARLALIGLVSPYLQLYDEFTAQENLQLALAIRGMRRDNAAIDGLLQRVGLFHRRHDQVRTYSSGMKQRVKYAFALLHRPPILILDEPMANLDSEGIGIVRDVMKKHHEKGLLIVATNDLSDLETFDIQVDLNATR